MARQILIVHGQSKTSDAFHALARRLHEHGFDARTMSLGGRISMDDDALCKMSRSG